mgnify:FL=1
MIVLLAYVLIFNADYFSKDYYYFACSISYSIVSIACCYLPKSKLITMYATANLLTAIAYLVLNFTSFNAFKYLIWDAPLNLSLISEGIELMLISSGAASVSVFITNHFFINTVKRAACGYSMAKVK